MAALPITSFIGYFGFIEILVSKKNGEYETLVAHLGDMQ